MDDVDEIVQCTIRMMQEGAYLEYTSQNDIPLFYFIQGALPMSYEVESYGDLPDPQNYCKALEGKGFVDLTQYRSRLWRDSSNLQF